jgi:hypothetical protein
MTEKSRRKPASAALWLLDLICVCAAWALPALRPGQICFLCFLLVAAMAIRICGAWNDLWLDEIWSLTLVGPISSPWQVFTQIHHDNNHYLT